MRLVSDWKYVLRRAWSVRLTLIVSLLSAVETGFQYWVDGHPSLIVITSFIISISVAVARVVDQTSLYDAYEEAP